MKRFAFAIILLVCAITNIILLCRPTYSVPISGSSTHGSVKIKVLEQNTLEPVVNASVCIVETRHYEQTDKQGYTDIINVPILSNPNFDISLKRDWGEFTIIVYKKGYSTYVSFYNEVYANTTNVGIVCYLSPIINQDDPPIITNVNRPNSSYVEALVKLFVQN